MLKKDKVKQGAKRRFCTALAGMMAFSLIPAVPSGVSAAQGDKPVMLKAGSIPVSESQVTYGEPFAQWTAGSQFFRIPALINLQDGTLLATADARWETTADGGGLDSIASISVDGGNTWNYSFPLFFPDSDGYAGREATTIIDPGIVEGPDGTIYFIADVNPTGSTTMYKTIGTGTGYVTVDNAVDQGRYLALTEDYNNVDKVPSDDNLNQYPYYVSELDEDGYALILRREDGSETGYGVDEWYNLYTVENGEFIDDLRQKQVNTDTQIQQNAFYKGSKFHVYSIDYLWVVTSKDGGRTWEHPRDLTDQIKRRVNEHGLLVSPGQGITTDAGDIVIGFYNTQDGEENSSIVYTQDNGTTWKRTADVNGAAAGGFWSSENEIVELWDGTLRMFVRNGQGRICYADAVKNEAGEYEFKAPVRTEIPSITTGNGCNISAIGYSKPIDGKQAILVTTPTGNSRAKGKIFTFLVEADNSLTLYHSIDIPGAEDGYVYSCLTELQDGTVGLLWEPNKWSAAQQISILFDKFSILDLAPQAELTDVMVNVELGLDGTYTRTYGGAGEPKVTLQPDALVAAVDAEAGADGKTITITGFGEGVTKAIVDGVMYKIKVTDHTQVELPSCSHANTYTRGEAPADCLEDGYTGDVVCSSCGKVLEQGERIAAVTHDWDEGVVTREVTETENGEKVYHCKNEPFHTWVQVIYASGYASLLQEYQKAEKELAQAGVYTASSIADLREAFEEQTQAVEGKGAGRKEMYYGAAALREAREALITRPVGSLKTELSSAIARARADYAAGKGSLPDSVWNDFKTAYDQANTAAPDAPASELWALTNALSNAWQKVRAAKQEQDLAAAKSELAAGIAHAKAVYDAGGSSYTADSWNSFVSAYNDAVRYAAAPTDAVSIRNMLSALQKAQAGLAAAPTPQEGLKAGKTHKYKNVQYKVLNAKKKTVMVQKGLKKSDRKVTIPATVKVDGVSCTVVQIGANAFKGYSKLTQVTIGKNVTSIGKNAFANCKKLAKVTLKGTKLSAVSEGAFKNTSAKMKVNAPGSLKSAKRKTLLKKLKNAGMNKNTKIK